MVKVDPRRNVGPTPECFSQAKALQIINGSPTTKEERLHMTGCEFCRGWIEGANRVIAALNK